MALPTLNKPQWPPPSRIQLDSSKLRLDNPGPGA
jgi:hypothetical protein